MRSQRRHLLTTTAAALASARFAPPFGLRTPEMLWKFCIDEEYVDDMVYIVNIIKEVADIYL